MDGKQMLLRKKHLLTNFFVMHRNNFKHFTLKLNQRQEKNKLCDVFFLIHL
jgi:hypothetical protein